MNVSRRGMRLYSRASVRTSSSDGVASSSAGATLIQHPLGVAQRQAPAGQQHAQVVEDVSRFLRHSLVRLLGARAGDLLRLLVDLFADPVRVSEQGGRIRAV